jgi:hypothetical protein
MLGRGLRTLELELRFLCLALFDFGQVLGRFELRLVGSEIQT